MSENVQTDPLLWKVSNVEAPGVFTSEEEQFLAEGAEASDNRDLDRELAHAQKVNKTRRRYRYAMLQVAAILLIFGQDFFTSDSNDAVKKPATSNAPISGPLVPGEEPKACVEHTAQDGGTMPDTPTSTDTPPSPETQPREKVVTHPPTSMPTSRPTARKKPERNEFALASFPPFYQTLIKEKIETYREACETVDSTCLLKNITQAVERARPFLHHVKQMLKEKGVPETFAYLPFAESYWDNINLSPSPADAYGIAQFIRSTANGEGMILEIPISYRRPYSRYEYQADGSFDKQVTLFKHTKDRDMFLYDERRDTIIAARNMANYLEKIKRLYCGNSWVRAAFGYNWGPGNVRPFNNEKLDVLLKHLKAKHEKHNHETYSYVANIMALAHVVKTEFEQKYPDQFPKATYKLVMYEPPAKAQWFKVKLQPGESPSHIAARYNVPLSKLLQVNNLSTEQCTKLPAGYEFTVPATRTLLVTPGKIRRYLGMTIEDFYMMNQGILAPWYQIDDVDHEYIFNYKVKKGDTLTKIAKKFKNRGVTVEELKDANKGISDKPQKDTWIRIKGHFTINNTENTTNQDGRIDDATRMKQIEAKMPPIPANWEITVPPDKEAKLQAFFQKMYQSLD